MSEDYQGVIDSAKEVDIENLVELIFSKPPQKPSSVYLLPDIDESETDSASYIFELFVDIYIEAVIDGVRLFSMLQSGKAIQKKHVDKIDIYNIKEEHLLLPNPWFKSFGYVVKVSEYPSEEFNELHRQKLIPHLYYKLLLKDNPVDNEYFIKKKINRIYHFVKNIDYVQTNVLEDISMLIVKPKDPNNANDISKCFLITFAQNK